MAAGSAAEAGRRFLLDCTDFDADSARPEQGNLQDWVPLVYPDANGAVPHVMIRLPLQPERPPTADKKWKQGDRVEVSAGRVGVVERDPGYSCKVNGNKGIE